MSPPRGVFQSRRLRGKLTVHTRVAELSSAAAAPPIVLVHGLVVSSRYMLPTAQHLAPWWRVHVPDLPGYGKGDKPRRAFGVRELADSLAEYVAAMDLSRAAFIGNSFGRQVVAIAVLPSISAPTWSCAARAIAPSPRSG